MVWGPQPNIGAGWSSTGGRGRVGLCGTKQGPGGSGGAHSRASGDARGREPGRGRREARCSRARGCESWGRRGGAPWWACASAPLQGRPCLPGERLQRLDVCRLWTVTGRAAQWPGCRAHGWGSFTAERCKQGSFTGLVGPSHTDQPLQPYTHSWTDVSPWGWAGRPSTGGGLRAPSNTSLSGLASR